MSRRRSGLVVGFWVVFVLLVAVFGVVLNVPLVKGSGTIYIRADGSIDPPDAPISTVDNVTYTLTGNITSDSDGIVVERSNIIIDGAGYTVEGTGSGNGFYINEINNVTIKGTTITFFYRGIWLKSSFNSVILRNSITGNGEGITLESSFNSTVSENNITSNTEGILMSYSWYNTVSRNNITIHDDGIVALSSCYNIFSENIIINNMWGIYLLPNSDNNIIIKNNITNNWFGIHLSRSSNNTILENHMKTNTEYGIKLIKSSKNEIYHNNFVNNTQQIYMDPGYANFWDDFYPSGGNYWSDYTGEDYYSGPHQNILGSDGIGDSQYIIDLYNRDNYPLMEPWISPPADTAANITNLILTDQNGEPQTNFTKGDIVQSSFSIENIGSFTLERALVSVMVLDPTNSPIFLSYLFEDIRVRDHEEFIVGYPIPLTATNGTYTVKIMVFTDWPSKGGTGLDIETTTFEVA